MPARFKRRLALEVGHKAKVTDTDKAFGQNVREETSDELVCGEIHDAWSVTGLAIDVSELNLIAVETDEAVVGDRHAMGVTAQIPENLFGTAEGRFGIDDSGVDVKTPNPGTETDRIFQGLKLWRETDLVGGDKVFEAVEKLAAKDTTEWGEAPQAFVVLARDASLTEAELIRHARDHMAHFKAPRKVEFVTELPKTATGKIQKYVLRRGRTAISVQ